MLVVSPSIRKMMDNSKPLPHATQKQLVEEAQKGSTKARNQLIASNSRFILKIVKRYYQPNIEFDDLYSEGMIGLNIAIDRFKLYSKNSFLSYAVHWIRERVSKHVINNLTNIRLPHQVKERDMIKYMDINHSVTENGTPLEGMLEQNTFESQESEQYRKRVSEIIELMLDEVSVEEKHVIKGVFGFYGEDMKYKEFKPKYGLSKFMVNRLRYQAMEVLENSEELIELMD